MVKIKSALQISNYLSRCRDHGKKLVIRLIQRFQEVYFCFSVQFVQSFSSFGLKNENMSKYIVIFNHGHLTMNFSCQSISVIGPTSPQSSSE